MSEHWSISSKTDWDILTGNRAYSFFFTNQVFVKFKVDVDFFFTLTIIHTLIAVLVAQSLWIAYS